MVVFVTVLEQYIGAMVLNLLSNVWLYIFGDDNLFKKMMLLVLSICFLILVDALS